MKAYLSEHGPVIEHDCQGWIKHWSRNDSVITWGRKLRSEQYTEGGRNVLFMENGLMNQSAGVYCDHRGYYHKSSLLKRLIPADYKLLSEHYDKWYKLPFTHDPSGPLLVCLQMNEDGPLRNYFPAAKGRTDRVRCFINLVKKHATQQLLIRAHPKEILRSSMVDGLEIDKSITWLEAARKCSGIVTVNSTVAVEALGLGIPVATFGDGIFQGYTLDCRTNYTNLSMMPLFQAPDAGSLLTTILVNQQPYAEFRVTESVTKFLEVYHERLR